MCCNTVGFERNNVSNFESFEKHFTGDNGFCFVVAVDNQKIWLKGGQIEVAS